MRDVLFRGKRVDNGEWVQGAYSHHTSLNRGFIVNVGVDHISPIAWTCEVDPETIGQYTGLTDKNGTKVFENDIVMFGFSPCVVKYDLPNGRYMFYEKGVYLKNGFNVDTMKTKEIIGNTIDNPELLKGE